MREIKFRGKDIATNIWVYGYYVKGAERHCIKPHLAPYPEFDININTLGQYTGLKDKNGIEIYEGDIVQCYDDGFSIIKYNNDVAMFEIETQDIVFTFDNVNIKDVKVVGNIYDNYELLEVKDDSE